MLHREIEKGKYAESDTFAHFDVIIEKRNVLLLTDHRVLYCEKNDLFGGWQVSLIQLLPNFMLLSRCNQLM